MCGLVGFLGGRGFDTPAADILNRMSGAIAHRGPDSDGAWFDASAGIGLGHRRLAILELSPAGAQPMRSPGGRWVLVFNGEIYNHLELRAELEKSGIAPQWRGHSDTETLATGFDAWGIEATVKRCVGMFAFAAWCRQTATLTLGRDRLGEKPLYYGWHGTGDRAVFLFGSELKALRTHPAFDTNIDRRALASYMRQMTIAGTQSIYTGTKKVPPGTLLKVSMRARDPEIRSYWSGAAVARQGYLHPFSGTENEAVDALERLLKHAVGQQMMADVPLGAFLSGGVDSSAIAALMQVQSASPIKTFSIGFSESSYDEAQYAKAVASHLGTNHTELYVTPEEAMSVIPLLPSLYDEPFADSSQIPTHLVSKMARQHVTVALSGDAGDELFAGYNRYQLTASYWHRLEQIPLPMRKGLGWAITQIAPSTLDQWAHKMGLHARWATVGNKLHKGAAAMGARSIDELYDSVVAVGWAKPGEIVIGAESHDDLGLRDSNLDVLSDIERMMALDMLHYLPDDILTKVDRAAMGVSLETRVPFLDHRVVEFAWSLPAQCKLRKDRGGHITKWALREVLYRHVPKSLIERPKMGFGIPLEHWLRGPLRDWAEDLLSEQRLQADGYLHSAPIRKRWAEHLSGQRNWQHSLWCVLMFQAWLTEQNKQGPAHS